MDDLARVGLAGVAIEALAAAIETATPLPPARIDADRPSPILFTSGTSGRPKAAPLMHGGAMLISDAFDAGRTLARRADLALAVTHYFWLSQMAAMLGQHPGFDHGALGGLNAICAGGAPHPAPAIRAWLDDGIAMVDGFGMSKAGTVFGMPVDLLLIAACRVGGVRNADGRRQDRGCA